MEQFKPCTDHACTGPSLLALNFTPLNIIRLRPQSLNLLSYFCCVEEGREKFLRIIASPIFFFQAQAETESWLKGWYIQHNPIPLINQKCHPKGTDWFCHVFCGLMFFLLYWLVLWIFTIAFSQGLKNWAEALWYSSLCIYLLWGSTGPWSFLGQLDHSRPSIPCPPSLRQPGISEGLFPRDAESYLMPTSSFWQEAQEILGTKFPGRKYLAMKAKWQRKGKGASGPLFTHRLERTGPSRTRWCRGPPAPGLWWRTGSWNSTWDSECPGLSWWCDTGSPWSPRSTGYSFLEGTEPAWLPPAAQLFWVSVAGSQSCGSCSRYTPHFDLTPMPHLISCIKWRIQAETHTIQHHT